MHPSSRDYHLTQIERLSAAFTTIAPTNKQTAFPSTIYVAAGEPIFSGHEREACTYLVTSGEVIIFRNGRPVDLLEPGELFDLRIWPGAYALARANCTLIALSTPTVSA